MHRVRDPADHAWAAGTCCRNFGRSRGAQSPPEAPYVSVFVRAEPDDLQGAFWPWLYRYFYGTGMWLCGKNPNKTYPRISSKLIIEFTSRDRPGSLRLSACIMRRALRRLLCTLHRVLCALRRMRRALCFMLCALCVVVLRALLVLMSTQSTASCCLCETLKLHRLL